MKTISIDDDVYAHIASRTADIGESASQVLRREMNMGSQLKTVFIEEDVYHYLIIEDRRHRRIRLDDLKARTRVVAVGPHPSTASAHAAAKRT